MYIYLLGKWKQSLKNTNTHKRKKYDIGNVKVRVTLNILYCYVSFLILFK